MGSRILEVIKFEKHTLDNGLRVLLHSDKSSPLVAVNVLYDVGARDEDPSRTGFAHLFEHLMFGGSLNVPDFDIPIQFAGGDNNAFTNCDITNFYNILPKENIETALWLESDRMLQLDFSQEMLDIQKKVVVEEFKETCLNVPYGDMWHQLVDLCYKDHPYKWPTIGKDFSHIEKAKLIDVENFFNKHYHPGNAILCISGNFDESTILNSIKNWFGPIPPKSIPERKLDQETKQTSQRSKITHANVPGQNFIVAYHMVDRLHPDYLVFDLISDLLSTGKSSRLYQRLVKKGDLYSSLSAYISGTMDPGLFILDGKVSEGQDYMLAVRTAKEELYRMKTELVSDYELSKIKNKIISLLEFSELSILNKAINLSQYELLGDAELINKQGSMYEAITAQDIHRVANEYFVDENCNSLIYLPNAN